MASRYWVGGTANWDGTAGTKWATTSGGAGGASVPTSADDVFLDANSGAVTVTIATGQTGAKSLNCTGFTGTLTGTSAISIAGSVTLSASMTFTYADDLTITGTGTVTTNGITLNCYLVINAPGGTVTLGSALNVGASDNFVLTAGTFNTSASNYSVTAQNFISNNSNTRTLTLNGSTITITGTNGSWDFRGSNQTLNAGTSTIVLSGNSPDFLGGGLTYRNVSFTATSDGFVPSIYDANTFTNLTLASPTAGVIEYQFRANQTISTFVASGAAPAGRILLSSDVLGTARTLTVTTWSTRTDTDFRDIAFNSARSGTRFGDCGGNTNITFATPKTVYWNLAGTQNWSATGWATSSGGTPGVNNFPLPQDTVVFDNTGSAGTVTIASTYNVKTIDASARTSAMTLTCAAGNSMTFYGDFVNGSGVTLSGTGRFNFFGRSPQTITTAGKTVTQAVTVQSVGSSVTLQDALTISVITASSLQLLSGTLDMNGYNVTITSGSFNGDGTTARTLAFSGSTLTVGSSFDTSTSTNLSVTGSGTIRLTSASQKSCLIGSADYSGITVDQAGAGLLVFNNTGTIGNISNSYASTGATSIRFDANQTVGDFTASGQAGKVLTITSSIPGVARTLTKTSGVVAVDYLSIRDSTATGGAAWYAGANSTNVSNNTGWIFTAAPSAGGGNFIAFFM